MSDNIFNRIPDLNYTEVGPTPLVEEFDKIVRARRSVRVYKESEAVPEEVMRQVLDWSLLAPNSSNLQCWEFIWVRDQNEKKKLAYYCFNQPAAKTAAELVVAVARPSLWKKHAKEMLELFDEQERKGQMVPKAAIDYYKKIVPFIYSQGPLGLFGFIKRPLIFCLGLFKVVPRQPVSPEQLKKWAVKSTALACENFMLGMTAQGFDTCPMEGFDERKVKKQLGLKLSDEVAMIISCGKRDDSGVYGPRLRFDNERFIRII